MFIFNWMSETLFLAQREVYCCVASSFFPFLADKSFYNTKSFLFTFMVSFYCYQHFLSVSPCVHYRRAVLQIYDFFMYAEHYLQLYGKTI